MRGLAITLALLAACTAPASTTLEHAQDMSEAYCSRNIECNGSWVGNYEGCVQANTRSLCRFIDCNAKPDEEQAEAYEACALELAEAECKAALGSACKEALGL